MGNKEDRRGIFRRIECSGCGRYLAQVNGKGLTLFIYCRNCGVTTQVFADDTDEGLAFQRITKKEEEELIANDDPGKSNPPGNPRGRSRNKDHDQ